MSYSNSELKEIVANSLEILARETGLSWEADPHYEDNSLFIIYKNEERIGSIQVTETNSFSNKEIVNHPNYNPQLIESLGNPLYKINPNRIFLSNRYSSVQLYSTLELNSVEGDKNTINKIISLSMPDNDLYKALRVLFTE